MIVDDFVEMIPKLKEIVDTGFIVKVPFQLAPENSWGDSWAKVPTEFLPSTEAQKSIWKEIRLPYDNLILVSQMNAKEIVLVKSRPRDDGYRDIQVTLLMMGVDRSQIGLRTMHFATSMEGALCIPPGMSKDASKEIFDRCVDDSVDYDYKLISKLEISGVEYDPTELANKFKREERDGFHLDYNLYAIYLTATAVLFSCKNIVQEAIIADASLQKRRKERGLLPLYRYHILKVKLSRTQISSLVGGDGEPVAIHWVRGHFKRYTEDKKLFGKYTGMYWWQPHLAGQADRVVDKDYELEGK